MPQLSLYHLQEKQEQGVKQQFETSIVDAKSRISKAREVLGQEHAEVTVPVASPVLFLE